MAAGRDLVKLHLDHEDLEPYPLEFQETPSGPLSYRVEDKMRHSKDKMTLIVNPSLALTGITPETFQSRLGGRSALEWVIDQYQVSEDRRSGIRSDPNRRDDPEYIVNLVGRVVQVSLKAMAILDQQPDEFMRRGRRKAASRRNETESAKMKWNCLWWTNLQAKPRVDKDNINC